MPTYEYACEKCGHQFEKFQAMSDPPLTRCPKELCPGKTWGRGKVRKIIGAGAGLIFKGSGFYITDYRSEKYKEAAKKESGAAGGGSETKPATTTPAANTPAAPTPKTESKSGPKPAKTARLPK